MNRRLKEERYKALKEGFEFAVTRYSYAPSYEAKAFIWNELLYFKKHIKLLERELYGEQPRDDDDGRRGA